MIDIKEFNIPRHILNILLKDRTTNQNILWGTDQYGYDPKSSIEISQIISGDVIKPRVLKSLEDQKSRTDSKAEVYTPIDIIKKMNDSVDDANEPLNEKYLRRKVLDVTCGEAPYLVSRYDVSTGKMIPLSERQGLLDRKMRRINNIPTTKDIETWRVCTIYALQAVYGYEWQGDSLLLARENVLYDVVDWFEDRFQKEMPYQMMEEFANIISYNIFQMDGVTMCVPYSDIPAKVMNWELDEMERFDGQPEELSLF
jgi:type II restriction enzyme